MGEGDIPKGLNDTSCFTSQLDRCKQEMSLMSIYLDFGSTFIEIETYLGADFD